LTDSRVAKRYARALFNAASKDGKAVKVEESLNAVQDLLRNHARFREIIEDPNVETSEKKNLIVRSFTGKIDELAVHALRLLLEKGRMDVYPVVVEEYALLRQEAEGVVHVTVASAMELDDDQKKQILDQVEKKFNRQVEPEFKIDPSLIGGVRLSVGTTELDGSVRGSLNRMRKMIIRDLLKQT
jgi:F-type H+-transporting ATPase subunit delta